VSTPTGPQGQSQAVSPPPSRQPRRVRIIILVAILLLFIGGLAWAGATLGSDNSKPAATPATGKSCVPLVNKPYTLAVTVNYPAGSSASNKQLVALSGTAYTQLYYLAAAEPAAAMTQFIANASCAGKTTVVSLDDFFNTWTEAQVKSLLWAVDGTPNLAGYALGQNAKPGTLAQQATLFSHRAAIIRSVSHKPISGLLDFNRTGDPAVGIGMAKAFNADVRIPVYLPWQTNPNWPVSAYLGAGQQAKAISPSGKAMVAVQAFDWGTPGAALGFTKVGLPSPTQVGSFASLTKGGGTINTLVYSQEPDSDNPGYIRNVGDKVDSVLAAR
jgi:hypothetical protein